MFNKALWLHNYKQAKFALWGFWIASLYFPYKYYSFAKQEEYSILHWAEWGNDQPYQFYFGNFMEVPVFQILLLLVLATILIGLERTSQSMDFTLSLPYRRREIFLSKWAIGTTNLVAAISVSMLLTIFINENSLISDYCPVSALGYYYIVSIFTLTAVFTFGLFVGFIGPSIVSQFAFSVIFLAFPYGFYNLVMESFTYHYYALTGYAFNQHGFENIDQLFQALSFPILLLDVENKINDVFVFKYTDLSGLCLLFIPIVITILSLYFMVKLSKKMKSENNGKLLAYEQLLPYLKAGVIVCFYLFGGMMIGNATYRYNEVPGLGAYHLGGVGFSALAYFILSKLVGMRIEFGKK